MTQFKAALFLVFAFCFASVSAQAQTDNFQDWNTVKDYLSSQGLNTNNVNWPSVEGLCQDAKLNNGDHAYNKCLYERAKDNLTFTSDKATCVTKAKGQYPDVLGSTETVTERDASGKIIRTYQRTTTGVTSPQGVDQQRAGAISDCMQKSGWADANEWQHGKRTGAAK